jgi:hypothetical protein
MVLTNRKGDFLLPKKGLAKRKGVSKKKIPSVYQFTQGVPRPAPIAVTNAIQLSATGATKAQVLPTSAASGMSKKKKGAIIGGTIGGFFGAAWAAGGVMNYMDKRKFDAANADYAKKSEDAYQLVKNQAPTRDWNRGFKEYLQGGAQDVGVANVTSSAVNSVSHTAPSSEASEWFDAIDDISKME